MKRKADAEQVGRVIIPLVHVGKQKRGEQRKKERQCQQIRQREREILLPEEKHGAQHHAARQKDTGAADGGICAVSQPGVEIRQIHGEQVILPGLTKIDGEQIPQIPAHDGGRQTGRHIHGRHSQHAAPAQPLFQQKQEKKRREENGLQLERD